MNVDHSTLRFPIDSPAYFAEAAADYQRARDSYYEARDDALTNASEAERLRGQLKDAEAEAICNGVALGKNEVERTAALRVYLATDPAAEPYRQAAAAVRSYELAKAQSENVAEEAANTMSVARRRMDAYIAATNRAAAIAANAGMERQEVR